jgi:hypothetical protein
MRPGGKVRLFTLSCDIGTTRHRERRSAFGARSRYVERVWVPILGPTATLTLRLFSELLQSAKGDALVPIDELAKALGLGAATGKRSAFTRSLSRLERHQLTRSCPDASGCAPTCRQ